MANPYEIAYKQSIEDPDTFWAKAAEDCHWYKKWDKVLDDSNKPFYRWFSGGEHLVTRRYPVDFTAVKHRLARDMQEDRVSGLNLLVGIR